MLINIVPKVTTFDISRSIMSVPELLKRRALKMTEQFDMVKAQLDV